MNSRHGLHSKMFRKFVHLSVKKVSIHLSLESLLLVWEVSARVLARVSARVPNSLYSPSNSPNSLNNSPKFKQAYIMLLFTTKVEHHEVQWKLEARKMCIVFLLQALG